MSGKEQVLEAVAKMPDESTFEELVERLQLLAAIRVGQEQIRRRHDVTPGPGDEVLWRWSAKFTG